MPPPLLLLAAQLAALLLSSRVAAAPDELQQLLQAVPPLPRDRSAALGGAWVTGGPCDKSADVEPERLRRNGTELTLRVLGDVFAARWDCRAPGVACWDLEHPPCHPARPLPPVRAEEPQPFLMPVYFGPVNHSVPLVTGALDTRWIHAGYTLDTGWIHAGYRLGTDTGWVLTQAGY